MSFKVIKTGLTMALFWFFTTAQAQTIYNLQQALEAAKTNNPILKREQYNISISQADITTASLRPNPIINNQSLQLIQPNRFLEKTGWANGANRQVWWQVTKPFQLPVQRENKIK